MTPGAGKWLQWLRDRRSGCSARDLYNPVCSASSRRALKLVGHFSHFRLGLLSLGSLEITDYNRGGKEAISRLAVNRLQFAGLVSVLEPRCQPGRGARLMRSTYDKYARGTGLGIQPHVSALTPLHVGPSPTYDSPIAQIHLHPQDPGPFSMHPAPPVPSSGSRQWGQTFNTDASHTAHLELLHLATVMHLGCQLCFRAAVFEMACARTTPSCIARGCNASEELQRSHQLENFMHVCFCCMVMLHRRALGKESARLVSVG